MCILSLVSQGSTVTKQSKRLIVKIKETLLENLPIRKIEGILAFGNINFSNPALALLSQSGISLSLLSYTGKMKGQVLPFHTKNLDLRYKQYEILQDNTLSLDYARHFVLRKLDSANKFVEINRKAFSKSEKDELSIKLDYLKKRIELTENYNSLLGYEANISKLHFRQFDQLNKSDMTFEKRSYHPPKNEINSLLSFTYTLMTTLVNSFAHSVGLDIYGGFLHKLDYGRPSLSLDIVELYRHSLLDKFVLNLVNRKTIKKEDFIYDGAKHYLSDEGKRAFLSKWSELIHSESNVIKSLENNTSNLIKAIRAKKIPKLEAL